MKTRGLKQNVNASLSSEETRLFHGFLVAVQRPVYLAAPNILIFRLPQPENQASWDLGSLLDSALGLYAVHLPGHRTEILKVALRRSLRHLPLDQDLRCRAPRPPVPLPSSGRKGTHSDVPLEKLSRLLLSKSKSTSPASLPAIAAEEAAVNGYSAPRNEPAATPNRHTRIRPASDQMIGMERLTGIRGVGEGELYSVHTSISRV